tara:strand:+ start:9629 stop:9781 length:153 start_codon:yes stop_codon:yes gene_type:complete
MRHVHGSVSVVPEPQKDLQRVLAREPGGNINVAGEDRYRVDVVVRLGDVG